MREFIWVCIGGAVGSGARYLVSLALARHTLGGLSPGTLAVNVLGSFLLGLLAFLSAEAKWVPPLWRVALGVGVLGGFTTYSTFNQETLTLLRNGAWAPALAYVAATVLACLLAGAAGFLLGGAVAGSR